jgi:hypothetical protein
MLCAWPSNQAHINLRYIYVKAYVTSIRFINGGSGPRTLQCIMPWAAAVAVAQQLLLPSAEEQYLHCVTSEQLITVYLVYAAVHSVA